MPPAFIQAVSSSLPAVFLPVTSLLIFELARLPGSSLDSPIWSS